MKSEFKNELITLKIAVKLQIKRNKLKSYKFIKIIHQIFYIIYLNTNSLEALQYLMNLNKKQIDKFELQANDNAEAQSSIQMGKGNYFENHDKYSPSLNDQKSQQLKQITFKIKDGLYLATSLQAFKDQQFILLNWIEHVVIFQNQQQPFNNQLKQSYGQQSDQIIEEGQQIIAYMHCGQNIFESFQTNLRPTNLISKQAKELQQMGIDQSFIHDIQKQNQKNCKSFPSNFDHIYRFIQKSNQNGSSCLILTSSLDCKIYDIGCLFSLCSSYLMRKYKWSLFKTLQFMNSRIKGISISEKSYQFLNLFEIQLLKSSNLTYDWETYQSPDELVLRNTYLNSKRLKYQTQPGYSKIVNKQTCIQKGKSKRKLQYPKKKLKTQIQMNQFSKIQISGKKHIKSILKQEKYIPNQIQTCPNQKGRIEIKLSLNIIKQYEVQPQNQNQQFVSSEKQIKSQINELIDNSLTQKTQKAENILTTSIIKQISLSVNKIVTKYREENIKHHRNSVKSFSFDDYYEMNLKSMKKKKSHYNFQTNPNQTEMHRFKNKDKSNYQDDILKIVKKIKYNKEQKQNLNQKQTKLSGQKNIKLFNQQKICSLNFLQTRASGLDKLGSCQITSRQNSSRKINQTQRQIFITKPQTKNWMNIIKNNKKQPQKVKQKDRTQQKQECYDLYKRNQPTSHFIKKIKEKSSINSKRDAKQNYGISQQNKNFKMQFSDFKQLLKKKQKSIGNLIYKNLIKNNDSLILTQIGQNIASSSNNLNRSNVSCVLQQLKKDTDKVQLNNLSTNTKNRNEISLNAKQLTNKSIEKNSIIKKELVTNKKKSSTFQSENFNQLSKLTARNLTLLRQKYR